MASESELEAQQRAAERAAATYAALQDFQGFAVERRELREAAVAEHRIDALYPQSYENLAAGALAHLKATGHRHLYHQRFLMNEMHDLSEETMCGHNEYLTRAWESAYPLAERAGAAQRELEEFLYDAFGETSEAQGVADDFRLLLWGSWICMRYRPQLSPEKQVDADFLMDWVGTNLLPELH